MPQKEIRIGYKEMNPGPRKVEICLKLLISLNITTNNLVIRGTNININWLPRMVGLLIW